MNRVFKFRVWHKKVNQFVLGKLAHIFGKELNFGNNDLIFQQFTGLTDKNGKEIYEGDILKSENNIGFIYFAAGCFFIDGEGSSWEHVKSHTPDCLFEHEIIGNICENPTFFKRIKK